MFPAQFPQPRISKSQLWYIHGTIPDAGPKLQRLLITLRREIWGRICACTDLGLGASLLAASTSSLWLYVITACSVSQMLSSHYSMIGVCKNDIAYLGNVPSRPPILPVHQSVAFSVRFTIVITSPFLNPRSPGWSASNVYSATA